MHTVLLQGASACQDALDSQHGISAWDSMGSVHGTNDCSHMKTEVLTAHYCSTVWLKCTRTHTLKVQRTNWCRCITMVHQYI